MVHGMSEDGSSEGVELPPRATSLMMSMRALGYSVEASIADLVDNSIAAEAETIGIEFAATPEPYLAVIDDGFGMDRQTLIEAMRFGSADPRIERHGNDLGRFGLGLKTASLAQCRKVTVLTIHEGELNAAEWDLDECEKRGTWWLSCPDPDLAAPEHAARLRTEGKGTVVLWRELDRLIPEPTVRSEAALDDALSGVPDHLGFTFHRFTDSRGPKPLRIAVNNRDVPQFDPFLEGHPRGQKLHAESFTIDGHKVEVTPFVLPFPSRLSDAELQKAGGRESVKGGHGFYIYRGNRLVVPGGWFRIVPSDELVRLARVKVDVPTQLDHLWKVDIRKTVLEPPKELRRNLRRIVGDASKRSRRVYQFRGNRQQGERHRPVWARFTGRDSAAQWRVDREHPVVRALASENANTVEQLLRLIENSLPVHDIHVHLANDVPVADEARFKEQELEALAQRLVDSMGDDHEARRALIAGLPDIEPFSRDIEMAERIAARLEP